MTSTPGDADPRHWFRWGQQIEADDANRQPGGHVNITQSGTHTLSPHPSPNLGLRNKQHDSQSSSCSGRKHPNHGAIALGKRVAPLRFPRIATLPLAFQLCDATLGLYRVSGP